MVDLLSMDADQMPCGCLRTTAGREVIFANRYLTKHFDWEIKELLGSDISRFLSRASTIFCDSYVFPQVLKEGLCSEVQLSVLTSSGVRRPVVANVSQLPNGDFVWVIIEADQRNGLFHELVDARETLEDQKLQLLMAARTDGLTNLLNRRAFDEEVERVFAEADRDGQPVSVFLLDIDYFKSINDKFGHIFGDRVLKELSQVLKMNCREQDVVARFGGDEFAGLLNHTSVDEAVSLCERIHATVAALNIDNCPLTVSIGVSGRAEKQNLSVSHALSEADEALYEAKDAGRNTTGVRHPRQNELARTG